MSHRLRAAAKAGIYAAEKSRNTLLTTVHESAHESARTMQIYCDFSGYSDMAIGIALIMGFKLAKNFDFPYNAAPCQRPPMSMVAKLLR